MADGKSLCFRICLINLPSIYFQDEQTSKYKIKNIYICFFAKGLFCINTLMIIMIRPIGVVK
jgi:hypothetical protein